ncbi:MAG: SDR family oxidoreductase [Chloroflexi bacterium]|nr:SDR family oxidoreductase [Chloroflexota bacterium]
MELRGAVAIVTGSSRGIGKAIALELAHRGCNVVVAARTVRATPQRRGTVQETAREVEALGVRALAVVTDVTSMLDVRRMVEEALGAFGRIDILVNNAGEIGDNRDFLEVTPEQWNAILGSNLFGAFHCSLAVAPVMVRQGSGAIINLTSGAAVRTDFLSVPYGVAKAGIDRLTRGIADDLKDRGVACVPVSPGTVATETVRRLYAGQDLSWAQPQEWTARAVADILEEGAMAYTGQVVSVRQYLEGKRS